MDRLEEIRQHIPLIAGQPMVCEAHPWLLWDGAERRCCAGPGMPLSNVETYMRSLKAAEAVIEFSSRVIPITKTREEAEKVYAAWEQAKEVQDA